MTVAAVSLSCMRPGLTSTFSVFLTTCGFFLLLSGNMFRQKRREDENGNSRTAFC